MGGSHTRATQCCQFVDNVYLHKIKTYQSQKTVVRKYENCEPAKKAQVKEKNIQIIKDISITGQPYHPMLSISL
jgi:hypothetical protein